MYTDADEKKTFKSNASGYFIGEPNGSKSEYRNGELIKIELMKQGKKVQTKCLRHTTIYIIQYLILHRLHCLVTRRILKRFSSFVLLCYVMLWVCMHTLFLVYERIELGSMNERWKWIKIKVIHM